MSEIQMYLINGLVGAISLITFYTFRSWYKGLEHQYRMYVLESEAKEIRDRLRTLVNSVSTYDIERLNKTIKTFGTTIDLQQQIAWFQDQNGKDRERIRKIEDRVAFLWRNTSGGEE